MTFTIWIGHFSFTSDCKKDYIYKFCCIVHLVHFYIFFTFTLFIQFLYVFLSSSITFGASFFFWFDVYVLFLFCLVWILFKTVPSYV